METHDPDAVVHLNCDPALAAARVRLGWGDKLAVTIRTTHGDIQKARDRFARYNRRELYGAKQSIKDELRDKDPRLLSREERRLFDDDCVLMAVLMNVWDETAYPFYVIRSVQPPGCACCGASERLKDCAKCRLTKYCSLDCQKARWSAHKADCRRFHSTGPRRMHVDPV